MPLGVNSRAPGRKLWAEVIKHLVSARKLLVTPKKSIGKRKGAVTKTIYGITEVWRNPPET